METLGPRLVIAGTHSGVGKTTVATGLLAALAQAGHRPAAAKVGPDFIDPGYHALACGRPPRNLDPWICGPGVLPALAGRAGACADVLVVEGVMGLFDGAVDGTPSSTADVAAMLEAPVILVVDAAALSGSVAALVSGYAGFRPDEVRVAGIVLNKVGSATHETLLRDALAPLGIPVVGVLHRDDALTWRDRHLGLVPVAEEPDAVAAALARLAATVAAAVDLDAVVRLARTAPPRSVGAVPLPSRVVPEGQAPLPVAVASGAAFTFTYTDTLDALVAAGIEPVPFDPRLDPALPDGVRGLIAGGGFPEVHAADLAANRPLLDDLRTRHSRSNLPIWAECGGLLWLCRSLDGQPLAGIVPADAHMTERLHLGYRHARTRTASPLGPAGTELRGHEFHYTTVDPAGDALDLTSRWSERSDGYASPSLLATYLHLHPGGDPTPVARFAETCARRRGGGERVEAARR